MARSIGEDEALVAGIKAELRSLGWFVRYTEWPSGHEVVLHARGDTSRHLVTDWHATELEAWRAALRLALEAREGVALDEPTERPPLPGPLPRFAGARGKND